MIKDIFLMMARQVMLMVITKYNSLSDSITNYKYVIIYKK